MATQTLLEAGKLINDDIVKGVVDDIITVNPIFSRFPFTGYDGQAIIVNREQLLGDAQILAIDGTITAKSAATYSQNTFTSTKLIGDAEMDGLVAAQSSSAGVDQIANEIASKAKSIGRLFQTGMATGTGIGPQMNSLHSLIDPSQITTASAGQALSLELMDELMDLVKSKDGELDFFIMPARTLRSYRTLVRSFGGVDERIAFDMPNGHTRDVSSYEGVPIFKNEYLSTTETANGALLTTGVLTSVWAGVFDDGTEKIGVSGIHPNGVPAGVQVEPVGAQETKDASIWRVKQYANFLNFNRRGLARLPSINN